jgi:peptidoglycan hydrolase CwlO-like protein
MFKKIKNWIIGLVSALGGLLVLFTIFKNKNTAKPKEVQKNEKLIGLIKKDLEHLETTKTKAKERVTELKKKADGRSTKVKNAKKEVEILDKTIEDLEAELKAKEKLIGL